MFSFQEIWGSIIQRCAGSWDIIYERISWDIGNFQFHVEDYKEKFESEKTLHGLFSMRKLEMHMLYITKMICHMKYICLLIFSCHVYLIHIPPYSTRFSISHKRRIVLHARSFCNVPHLTNIYIMDTPVITISRDAFLCLNRVMYLSLYNCSIPNIPPDLFKPVPNLHVITLRGKSSY